MSLMIRQLRLGNDSSDDLLNLCWRHQDCWGCLKEDPCSWCPTSSTCIPNTARIHILAPLFNPDICPVWSERWELRTRPLGCHVSTITFLTCIISVCSTFLVIGLLALAVKAGRRIRMQWKNRSPDWWRVGKDYHPGWWRGWRLKLVDVQDLGEQRPLLGEP